MTSLLSKVTRGGLGTSGFWATGFASVLEHEGDSVRSLDRKIDQYGFALGYSAQTDGLEWGVSGGYLMSDLDVDSAWATSQTVEGQGLFAGVNGEKSFGAFTIDLAVAGGRVTHDSKRFVNDNLALTNGLTLGQSWAEARYDGWFFAPEVGVSAAIGEWNGWSLTPSARLRHASQWLDGYKETGSNANASVGDRTLGLLEARVELGARKTMGVGSVSTRLGYQIRRSTGDDTAAVTLLDSTNSVGLGDTDSAAAYAGMGINLDITPGMQVYVDVTGYFGDDMTGGQASAKFAASF
ncbi:MAG: autotransporter outer membrane beta-barrel domain-containing protein [Rhizobiaceae bacterium]|nr:autotransporter outer membrane beta-barrel domain-containing protein [Rhizobiaceae bacterium]